MNFHQIKILEKIETSLYQKNIILNECDNLNNILNKCMKQSNDRLQLFSNHHNFEPFKIEENNGKTSNLLSQQAISNHSFFSKRAKH